ncbi:hypothetical protein LINGRAHAP2_LOCUS31765 [Linum grandiflorum]
MQNGLFLSRDDSMFYAFVMQTINKSQEQTLEHIGIYLHTHVFTHSQLYVALSRVRSVRGIRIIIEDYIAIAPQSIVYNEIFEDLQCCTNIHPS